MNFVSRDYLLFFPLIFLLHWLLPEKLRWLLLLAASWFFYLHWDLPAGLLLLFTTLVSWLCALGIRKTGSAGKRRLLAAAAAFESLGLLFLFKYAGFALSLTGREITWQLLLPVGISFYTFQTLSYVLDVYAGRREAETHFGYYALFVSFFPQLVAGPIERSGRLLPQLKGKRRLREVPFREALLLLLTGYFRKIVIADTLAPVVDQVFSSPAEAKGPGVLLAAALFGLQIYCDFSGYTNIARGSAKLLGIELSENFRRPYFAESLRDFWRRWHMTLTSFFTDYVYLPLGGNRKGLPRQLLATLIVFFLSGLWHGAGLTFLAWGGIHGIALCGEILVRKLRSWRKGRNAYSGGKEERSASRRERENASIGLGFLRAARHLALFAFLSFAWIFFRAERLSGAAALLSRLSSGWGEGFSLPSGSLEALAAALCLFLLDLGEEAEGKRTDSSPLPEENAPAAASTGVFSPPVLFLMLLVLCTVWLGRLSSGGPNAFIYFRF